ncbi:Hypothetical predicted protein [Mytilus galloprovincialis]|uniref:Uncharacterized protein n=1 Tax=Mytilus galloprovincialis TaxID=29158 RepID=A0A8B6FNI9_MYTGA|nr:Hypothetical predicted protein [Mytilus galloprovincialis]
MTMIKALVLLLCVAVAFGFNNGYYGDDDRFDLLDDDYRGLRLRLGGRRYSGARYIRPNVYPKYVHRVVSRPSILIHGDYRSQRKFMDEGFEYLRESPSFQYNSFSRYLYPRSRQTRRSSIYESYRPQRQSNSYGSGITQSRGFLDEGLEHVRERGTVGDMRSLMSNPSLLMGQGTNSKPTMFPPPVLTYLLFRHYTYEDDENGFNNIYGQLFYNIWLQSLFDNYY